MNILVQYSLIYHCVALQQILRHTLFTIIVLVYTVHNSLHAGLSVYSWATFLYPKYKTGHKKRLICYVIVSIWFYRVRGK